VLSTVPFPFHPTGLGSSSHVSGYLSLPRFCRIPKPPLFVVSERPALLGKKCSWGRFGVPPLPAVFFDAPPRLRSHPPGPFLFYYEYPKPQPPCYRFFLIAIFPSFARRVGRFHSECPRTLVPPHYPTGIVPHSGRPTFLSVSVSTLCFGILSAFSFLFVSAFFCERALEIPPSRSTFLLKQNSTPPTALHTIHLLPMPFQRVLIFVLFPCFLRQFCLYGVRSFRLVLLVCPSSFVTRKVFLHYWRCFFCAVRILSWFFSFLLALSVLILNNVKLLLFF